MSKNLRPSKDMLYLVEQFKRIHKTDEADPAAVARWARANGLCSDPPADPELALRRAITKALRTELYTDPQGRLIRRNHPVPSSDGGHVFWVDIIKAKPEQMRLSFTRRRNGVVGNVKQMSLDFDSYNDNNLFGTVLAPLDYDFRPDVEEAKLPVNYPEDAPVGA